MGALQALLPASLPQGGLHKTCTIAPLQLSPAIPTCAFARLMCPLQVYTTGFVQRGLATLKEYRSVDLAALVKEAGADR